MIYLHCTDRNPVQTCEYVTEERIIFCRYHSRFPRLGQGCLYLMLFLFLSLSLRINLITHFLWCRCLRPRDRPRADRIPQVDQAQCPRPALPPSQEMNSRLEREIKRRSIDIEFYIQTVRDTDTDNKKISNRQTSKI